MLVENTGGGGGGGGGGGEGKSTSSTSSGSKASGGVSKMGGGGGGNRPISTPSRTNNTTTTTNGTSSSSSSSSSSRTTNGTSTPTRATNGISSTPTRTPVTTTTNGTSLSRTTQHYTPTRAINGTSTPRITNGTPIRGPATPIRTTSTAHIHTTHTNRSTTSSSTSSGGGSKNATPTKSASGDLDNQLSYTPPHVLIRSISSLSQHSLRPSTPELDQEDGVVSVPALRKGVLLQARDRLFSRWKERYFVLTRDYLACFRRGSTKYSEMGSFIFKVNLASVETVEWQDRRGGPALALSLPREGRVLLRAKSGLDQWYRLLLEATNSSRLRRNALRRGTSTTHLNHTTNNNLDTTPPAKSVLADVDLGSCDTDVATPPSSVTSSNKFSTSTSASNTSGSGGSSSLASSPSLRGSCAWPRPSSPLRPVVGDAPRTRLSLYEGTRDMPTAAKMRHSVCLEPRDHQDIGRKQKNRHSICVEPRDLARTRASLCLEPRNPLLDLMESVEAIPSLLSHEGTRPLASTRTSPSKSEGDRRSTNDVPLMVSEVDTSPCPEESSSRPRAHSTSLTPERTLGPRSRSNLGFFRHSGLYNH